MRNSSMLGAALVGALLVSPTAASAQVQVHVDIGGRSGPEIRVVEYSPRRVGVASIEGTEVLVLGEMMKATLSALFVSSLLLVSPNAQSPQPLVPAAAVDYEKDV